MTTDARSASLLTRAAKVIPGGVNSPVRAFRAVGGQPIFIQRAHGSFIVGADGTEYIDYVGSWGPAILGHAHPFVVEAVRSTVVDGCSFGAPTEREVEFAEKVIELYPSIEKLRCVSSGTEATMSAVRAARGFTNRSYIVKFEGCYHGHADHLLVKAGSGLATFGVPDSAGVPENIAKTTLTLPFNDEAALRRLFTERGNEIACVIVEPVVGNMGCVPPNPGFLEAIVEVCSEAKAVSIFDEVMTGCRLALGGAQERFGLKPDMTTLGKIIGGGLPLAVYGGRAEIMNCIAPLGSVYQAGTLSGNPVAVSAGLATLKLLNNDIYSRVEMLGKKLETGFRNAIEQTKINACVQRVGSMITFFFQKGPVQNWSDASQSNTQQFAVWHQGMIKRGIYWPPSQYEAAFVSAAHSDVDIEKTIEAAGQALIGAVSRDFT